MASLESVIIVVMKIMMDYPVLLTPPPHSLLPCSTNTPPFRELPQPSNPYPLPHSKFIGLPISNQAFNSIDLWRRREGEEEVEGEGKIRQE